MLGLSFGDDGDELRRRETVVGKAPGLDRSTRLQKTQSLKLNDVGITVT
jgi:hypothetical protein